MQGQGWEIRVGDCKTVLAEMDAESVHACVTSPPYFGLRAYSTEPQVWGGLPDCVRGSLAHEWGEGASCLRCGAWKGELGQEPTPVLFVQHLTEVFREVQRVLRPDGLLFLNIDDTRSRNPAKGDNSGWGKHAAWCGENLLIHDRPQVGPEGTLCGIPWRLAFALEAQGWHLRQSIVWAKGNPLPESMTGWRWVPCRVKTKAQATSTAGKKGALCERQGTFKARYEEGEGVAEYSPCPGCARCEPHGGYVLRRGRGRCTDSYEFVFVFSKSDSFFWDDLAIAEPANHPGGGGPKGFSLTTEARGTGNGHTGLGAIPRATRTCRNVWTINTVPLAEAHFAAFPPELARRMILAGSSPQVCGGCGAPWARVVEKETLLQGNSARAGRAPEAINGAGKWQRGELDGNRLLKSGPVVSARSCGFRPTCACTAPSAPAVILDPFAGAGTTLMIARDHGRYGIGIELNAEYAALAARRLAQEALPLEPSLPLPAAPPVPAQMGLGLENDE